MSSPWLAALAVLGALLIGAAAWLYEPDKQRAALEARYAAPPSTFAQVAGIRLHLRDTGPRDAPPLLMLHGFGSSLHTWDVWAATLDLDHRVIRIDLPGFGLTGPDPTGDYSDTRAVAVISALLDQLGLPQVDLLGHSMGGRIAWTFAATHPERVRRLVLLAPDGFASPGIDYGVAPKVPLMMKALPYVLPAPMFRANLEAAFADPSRVTPALLERYRDMTLAPGVRAAILDRMAGHILAEPTTLLARITAPTLLVWGVHDGMVPASNAADYTKALRDSRLVTFPGVGHLPMEEAPDTTLPAIRDFLAR